MVRLLAVFESLVISKNGCRWHGGTLQKGCHARMQWRLSGRFR